MKIELIIDENGHQAFSINHVEVAYDDSDPVHTALLTLIKETLLIKNGATGNMNKRMLEYIENQSPGAVTELLEFFQKGAHVSKKHQTTGDYHAA